MEELIKNTVKKAVKLKYGLDLEDVHVEHPENLEFGDYSTNISMVLAKTLKQSPLEIAKTLCYELQSISPTFASSGEELKIFESISYLPPGFINLKFSDQWLHLVLTEVHAQADSYGLGDSLAKTKIILEYTDPNPFKVFHIGHLMTNCIGESLSRIFEFQGADVKRVNYQGDVGMHVAKSIWGWDKLLSEQKMTISDIENMPLDDRIAFLGKAYALGATAFEAGDQATDDIKVLNIMVYKCAQQELKSTEGWVSEVDYTSAHDTSSSKYDYSYIKELYSKGKSWSLEYFETLYKRLGTKFDYYYFESRAGEKGYILVQGGLKSGVFTQSEGAIVFKGEEFGLHTRVFINSFGLPVYEAKDLGLIFLKYDDYEYDLSYIITANEMNEYFKVVFKAMELIEPSLAAKTRHIGHGIMKLLGGKMSSRTGNVIAGDSLLNDIKETVLTKIDTSDVVYESAAQKAEIADKVAVASIKYAVLKVGIGGDIVYDEEKALSLTGDTGPYLQYTFARINSILSKQRPSEYDYKNVGVSELERTIMRKLPIFSEVCFSASQKASPSLIAAYAFDLAQNFNSFYAQISVLNEPNDDLKSFRLTLCQCVGHVLKNALHLLGIQVVDKM